MSGGLRFCMVTTFYPPYSYGGDGITVQRLARALVRAGHDVTVVHDAGAYAAMGRPLPVAHPNASGSDDGVEVVTLQRAHPRLSALVTHQLGRPVGHSPRLADVLSAGEFDVVHFHNVSLVGGPGVLTLAGDATVLYTAHEHWLVCPTHVLWRHQREPCDARECLRCTLRYRRPPQLWRHTSFFDRQLERVDTFIALSEFSRDKHREFGFRFPMTVLPPLVNEFEMARDEDEPPLSMPYFLCVGRLEDIKGIHTVIPLFVSDPPADLVIAGAGSQEQELRRLANASPHVHFIGQRSPDALRRYYRHARAHIAASICFETFGNTLVESLQQAAPVIARRLGPFPELIEESGGGVLFTGEADLRSAVERLASDDALRGRMGVAGRRAFEARWSERAVLPRYFDIVDEARGRRAGVPAALTPVAS